MCNCSKTQTVIKFGSSCGCGCDKSCNCLSTTNNVYLNLPPDGLDGEVLAKNGDSLIWVENEGGGSGSIVTPVSISISSNGQTAFPNVVPADKTLVGIFINGQQQLLDTDYTVTNSGRNINWISTDFDLQTTFSFTITVQ